MTMASVDFIPTNDSWTTAMDELITTGKLRVVVECRVKVDNSPGEWNGMHLFGCNGRGPVTDEVFCPYCGGSIIKPTQQP